MVTDNVSLRIMSQRDAQESLVTFSSFTVDGNVCTADSNLKSASEGHFHPEKIEFILFTKGNAVYKIAGVEYPIQAGDVFFIGDRQKHTIMKITEPLRVINICFEPRFIWSSNVGFEESHYLQLLFSLGKGILPRFEADWVGFANPTNENGDILKYIQTAYTTSGSYGAYVTNACDTEEELRAAMAWLNWAYTEEGILYWNFGTEGESFEYVDGKPKFAALLTEDERGIEQALRDYTGASAMPVGVQMEYFVRAKNSDAAGDSVDRWVSNQNARAYIVPGLPLTADEKKELTDITTPMNTYIAEIALKFITGEEPLDHFDKYLETLDTMGLERANEIQNEGYQRFMGK